MKWLWDNLMLTTTMAAAVAAASTTSTETSDGTDEWEAVAGLTLGCYLGKRDKA